MKTKKMAVQMLVDAREFGAAAALKNWRNRVGQYGGWDGWFRGQFPRLIDVIWQRSKS